MKTEKEILNQIDLATKELERIEKDVPPGNCAWRMQKRYVEALQWVVYGE